MPRKTCPVQHALLLPSRALKVWPAGDYSSKYQEWPNARVAEGKCHARRKFPPRPDQSPTSQVAAECNAPRTNPLHRAQFPAPRPSISHVPSYTPPPPLRRTSPPKEKHLTAPISYPKARHTPQWQNAQPLFDAEDASSSVVGSSAVMMFLLLLIN